MFAVVLRNADKSAVRPVILCSVRQFGKGAKYAGSVGHSITTMVSACRGLSPPLPPNQELCPWTPLGALPPDPRYRFVLCICHGALQPLTPFAAYDPCASNLPLILTSLRLWSWQYVHRSIFDRRPTPPYHIVHLSRWTVRCVWTARREGLSAVVDFCVTSNERRTFRLNAYSTP